MAEQKNTQPQKRGGKKKSDQKQTQSGGSASRRKTRKSLAYWHGGHKAQNVRRNLERQMERQRKDEAGASQSDRAERGQARAMRRASIALATGATRNLAAAERRLNPTAEEPTLERQIAGTIKELFGETAIMQFEAEKAKTADASA